MSVWEYDEEGLFIYKIGWKMKIESAPFRRYGTG